MFGQILLFNDKINDNFNDNFSIKDKKCEYFFKKNHSLKEIF